MPTAAGSRDHYDHYRDDDDDRAAAIDDDDDATTTIATTGRPHDRDDDDDRDHDDDDDRDHRRPTTIATTTTEPRARRMARSRGTEPRTGARRVATESRTRRLPASRAQRRGRPARLARVRPGIRGRGRRPRRRQHGRAPPPSLADDPLVQVLLRNPRRETYAGWDDAANRNRLLVAAAALAPGWIVSLDADERLDPDDAPALRRFLETDALPGCAFGLQHFRMWGPDRFDPRLHVDLPGVPRTARGRCSRRGACTSLPCRREIPRAAWLRTTIRVRHLGAARRPGVATRDREVPPGGPGRRVPRQPADVAPARRQPPALAACPPVEPVLRLVAPRSG